MHEAVLQRGSKIFSVAYSGVLSVVDNVAHNHEVACSSQAPATKNLKGELMIRCRSINRAIRRGHHVNMMSGTYLSKREQKIYNKRLEAAQKKAEREAEKENNNEQAD